MTISDVQNQLLGYYLNQTIFSIEKDLDKIVVSDRDADQINMYKKAIVLSALKNLENLDMIREIKSQDGKDVQAFILTKPIMAYPQTVSISPYCALSIATIVNSFLEASPKNMQAEKCNVLSITEKDLINLAEICRFSLETENEEEDDSDE